jgi:hypothetical protein
MIATKRSLVLAPFILVLAAACGSDDASTSATTVVDEADVEQSDTDQNDTDQNDTDESDTGQNDAVTDQATDETSEQESEAPATGGGAAATLTLANGEVFEFATVLCTLEPQMAAGSEILFTATSYDDPGLDVTQFGDEGTVTGLASISVYDGNFETLWEANSMLGSGVELTLDGSTIRGTGSFYEGDDVSGDTVEGEVVANC